MNTRPKPLFTEISELAKFVNDGDTVGIGGMHFCRIPVALLQAIVNREVKHLHYASWGGGLPLEMLLAGGCIDKLTFCFSSLDIFGMAPLFRRASEKNEIAVTELNALAFIQGLHAAQQHLPSMPYQTPVGSAFAAVSANDPESNNTVSSAAPLPIDVFLLHATRADTAGNVEIAGALGLDISMAWAARNILVTVEEIVPVGQLSSKGRGILPRDIVSAIAIVPNGAWPTSSPTHCLADFHALAAAFSSTPLNLSTPEPNRLEFLRDAAKLDFRNIPSSILRMCTGYSLADNEPASQAEIMIHRLAQEYSNESCCSAGAVSPLAIVSYLLAKQSHAPDLSIMTCSGGYVDIGSRPMLLLGADAADYQTASIICGGEDTYHWYYQKGLVTHEVVSAAQIDQYARTNNQWLRKPDGTLLRLPGQGGMADVANMHANFTLYLTRHSTQSLVEQVYHCSASRGITDPEERSAQGWANGTVLLVTDLCVCRFNCKLGEWEAISLHPGVTPMQLRETTGFAIHIPPDIAVTEVPDSEQLRRIRNEIDPLGFRRLEFVPSRQRIDLIKELVDSEEAALKMMLTGL